MWQWKGPCVFEAMLYDWLSLLRSTVPYTNGTCSSEAEAGDLRPNHIAPEEGGFPPGGCFILTWKDLQPKSQHFWAPKAQQLNLSIRPPSSHFYFAFVGRENREDPGPIQTGPPPKREESFHPLRRTRTCVKELLDHLGSI